MGGGELGFDNTGVLPTSVQTAAALPFNCKLLTAETWR